MKNDDILNRILDAVAAVQKDVSELKVNMAAMSAQVNDNIKNIEKLNNAYTSLAPSVETIRKHSEALNILNKRVSTHGSFIKTLKIAGGVVSALTGVLLYSAQSYIKDITTTTVDTLVHPQAVLPDRVQVTEKQKDAKTH